MIGKKLISSILIPTALLFSFNTPSLHASTEDTVKDYIEKFYVDEVESTLLQKDLETIFEQLDPYSTYFTEEEFQSFKDSINQEFVGVGIGVKKVDEGIYINQVFENSPAKDAGLNTGDIITAADGNSLKDKTIEQSVTYIKGEAGTSVNLTVKQDSKIKEITVERKKIQLPSVEGQKLGGDIGYIQLYTFSQQTSSELKDEMSKLKGVEHWILDVRNNPGGYLTASQQVLGYFQDVPTALIAEYRNKSLTYEPLKQEQTFEKPVSLLINENSASASEILAGSLQDYDAATLYGSTTFGKGLLQELLLLPEGGAVKLSTARFFTPEHNQIQNVGIQPDVLSETPLDEAHEDALKAAYDYKTFPVDEVLPEKTFEIQLTSEANVKSFESSISLVTVGGKEVDFDLNSESEDTILLNPKENLNSSKEYMLIVHPGWENTNGTTSTKGVIQPVQVQ